jgi:hypothetical protein
MQEAAATPRARFVVSTVLIAILALVAGSILAFAA